MKKILYIHHGWGIGGAPISLLTLIRNLNKKKYKPVVLFTQRERNEEVIALFEKDNIEVIFETRHNKYFRHHEKGKIKFYDFLSVFRIIIDWIWIGYFISPILLESIKPDIVHINSEVLSNWAFGARKQNIPVVCHNRDPIATGFRRRIIKSLLKNSVKKIISISKDNSRRLGLEKWTVVIYNPINDLFFKQNKNFSSKSKQVLFLGGSHKSKGLDLLLKSVPLLDENIIIKLAGYYPPMGLKSKIRNRHYFSVINKYKGRMEILGPIKQEEVAKELSNASLLLFPAKHPHFARPIIEAYATKTPVIATDIEGMDEIVIDGQTGYLVKYEPQLFADRINSTISDNNLLRHLGNNGYKFANEISNLNTNMKTIENIYEEISKK